MTVSKKIQQIVILSVVEEMTARVTFLDTAIVLGGIATAVTAPIYPSRVPIVLKRTSASFGVQP